MKPLLCLNLLGAMMWTGGSAAAEAPSLAERLGYKTTDKLLVINGDDAGMCHAANQATIECLETGLMTSATINGTLPVVLRD